MMLMKLLSFLLIEPHKVTIAIVGPSLTALDAPSPAIIARPMQVQLSNRDEPALVHLELSRVIPLLLQRHLLNKVELSDALAGPS